ncbi:MAG TPA: DUF3857 domain-containing protein [Bacteroidales bacterium]|nr:DUF3857 domain-containing protein [Bacteroidales bacterium]
MRTILSIFLIISSYSTVFSQFYPFDSIPDNLKKNADAVVRSSQGLYTILEPGKSTYRIRKAITLLNEEADMYRYIAVFYDKLSRIRYLRGTVYDEKGEVVKSMSPSEIFDMSAITGASFYTDDRMKIMRFPLYKFPYTIEYEYETEYSSILSYPGWEFQEEENVSVEKSGIQYVIPADMKLKFNEENLKNKVDSVYTDGKQIYTWQETNIPALSLQRLLGRYVVSSPVLNVAPFEFYYAGVSGNMNNWNSFGEWVYTINKGRDVLPDEEASAVKAIVSKFTDTKDKIKAVYEYMQSKTRYVSIQIGVGGFQTAEAGMVVRNGYGDCKALVTYTMALLKAAGIKSYYTLVRAGNSISDIDPGFVDNQFNHAILCVPLQQDTVWLECTNQELPFNYLGSFTSDRHVLVITPEGGKLVKTPEYRKEQNIIQRSGSLFFNSSGATSARLKTTYSGYYFGIYSNTFSMQSEGEMKKTLYSSLDYPDFTVTSASYSEKKSVEPKAEFQYQVSIKGFGLTSGKQIYFSPSLTKEDFLPEDTVALRIRVSDVAIDSIIYWLPVGYRIESVPGDVSLASDFGSYVYSVRSSGDRIIFYRRLELNKGFIPSKNYVEFRNFYNKIAKTDRRMIAISKT